jgi:hypothetical protein
MLMHILGLTVENFMRLSIVQITPDRRIVQITGGNEQGKTSVLDAIEAACGGGDALPAQPIRKGQKRANIRTILGRDGTPKLIVERRFTEKGSTLHVTSPEGLKYPSPQAALDELVGALTFDPTAFMGLSGKEQFELLRRLVKLDVDIDALDEERAMVYELRRGVNAKLNAAEAVVASIMVPADLPDEPPDRVAIEKRLADADCHNAAARQQEYQRQALQEHYDAARTVMEGAQRQLADVKARHARELAAAAEHVGACGADAERVAGMLQTKLAEPRIQLQDSALIARELGEVDRIIAGIKERERKAAQETAVRNYRSDSESRTARIVAIDKAKAEAIANAQMPIAGLAFTDGMVLFDGIPLDQASGAQKLRVSAAIGAALNPKLRVMLARDATNLDTRSMKLLADFAAEKDFQIWCERVDESGAVGVVIEDGHVKGQEELVLAQAKLALES